MHLWCDDGGLQRLHLQACIARDCKKRKTCTEFSTTMKQEHYPTLQKEMTAVINNGHTIFFRLGLFTAE